MAVAEVHAGVCGFVSRVTAEFDERTGRVSLQIDTECPNCKKLTEALQSVDGYEVALTAPIRNPVYHAAATAGLHAACPLPCGILKAVEVACGLTLPRDVSIRISR